MADLRLEGLDELLTQLQSLGNKAGRIESEALKAGGEVVQKEASKRAPRSAEQKEHLADHIGLSKIKTKDGVKYVEVGPQKTDNHLYYYGKFIEFGTSKKSAKPFLGPAFQESKAAIQNAMRDVIKRGLGL